MSDGRGFAARRWAALALVLSGTACGDAQWRNPLSRGDEQLSHSFDFNSTRLGASDIDSALQSPSNLAHRPRNWLLRQMGYRPEDFLQPTYTAPTSGSYLHLNVGNTVGTPAIICSPLLQEAPACRLLLIDANAPAVKSFKLNANGLGDNSNACTSATISTDSVPLGGAIALGSNGLDYYFLGHDGNLYKGQEDTVCGGNGVTPTNMTTEQMTVFTDMTPWVQNVGGTDFVYLVTQNGYIYTYNQTVENISPQSPAFDTFSSSPVVFNSTLWVGDDNGRLHSIGINSAGLPDLNNINSLDLCDSFTCADGSKTVSTPFIDVSNHLVFTTVQNKLISLDTTDLDNIHVSLGADSWVNGDANTPVSGEPISKRVYFASGKVLYRRDYIGNNGRIDIPTSLSALPLDGAVSTNGAPMVNPFAGDAAVYLGAGKQYYRFAADFSSSESYPNENGQDNVMGTPLSDGNYNIFTNAGAFEQQGMVALGGDCTSGGNDACISRNCVSHVCSYPDAVNINYVANGDVNAMVIDRERQTLYLGGDFTLVSPDTITGGGVPFQTTDGAPLNGIYQNIYAITNDAGNSMSDVVISDGSDGWYVGYHDGVMHLGSNGVRDLGFNVTTNDRVLALARDAGHGYLYIGGKFTKVNSMSNNRNHFAWVQLSDGSLLPNQFDANEDVNALVTDGTVLFVGGNFSTLGSNSRSHLASVSIGSNLVTDFDPNLNGNVFALAFDGNRLYAGGAFTTVAGGSVSRGHVVGYNDNLLMPFNPDTNGDVRALALGGSNTILYMGGSFVGVNSNMTDRQHLAAFNIGNNAVETNFDPAPDLTVYSLAYTVDTLYVGGNFLNIAGTARGHLAAVDPSSGSILSNFAPCVDDRVLSLALSTSAIYASGFYNHVNCQVRHRVAAFNLGSGGELTSFDPDVNGRVNAMALSNSSLIVGGSFTQVNGSITSYHNIAMFDQDGTAFGLSHSLNPDGEVYSVATDRKGNIYVGGAFNQVGSNTCSCFAAFDSNGAFIDQYPQVNGAVRSIAADRIGKDTVYIAGDFLQIGGNSRAAVGGVDTNNFQATSLGANNTIASQVFTIALNRDQSKLYCGGNFSTPTQLATAFTISDGEPFPFNYFAGADPMNNGDELTAIAFSDDGTIMYTGGHFSGADLQIGDAAYSNLISFAIPGQTLRSFTPDPEGSGSTSVRTIAPYNGSVYFGGTHITSIGGIAHPNLGTATR